MSMKNKASMRRSLLGMALACGVTAWPASSARAQSWPSRSIRLIVPFPPGGGTDSVARLIGDMLAQRLGQPVLIENRPGGSSLVGVDAVVKAPPDGHTLLISGASTFAIVPALRERMPFDVTRDLQPVALMTWVPLVIVTAASRPWLRLADLIAQAKAAPRTLTYATYGPGSQPHLAAELLADAAGLEMRAVPYKGSGDALIGLLRGDIDFCVEPVSATRAQITAGRLRALAVTSLQRSAYLPQVPGLEELNLAGASIQGFYALAAPANTPPAVLQRLASVVGDFMASPEARARCAELSVEAASVGPEAFRAVMTSEMARYRRLNQRLKVNLE